MPISSYMDGPEGNVGVVCNDDRCDDEYDDDENNFLRMVTA